MFYNLIVHAKKFSRAIIKSWPNHNSRCPCSWNQSAWCRKNPLIWFLTNLTKCKFYLKSQSSLGIIFFFKCFFMNRGLACIVILSLYSKRKFLSTLCQHIIGSLEKNAIYYTWFINMHWILKKWNMQHQFSIYEKKNTYLYNTCTSKYKLSNSKVHTLPVLTQCASKRDHLRNMKIANFQNLFRDVWGCW